MILGKNQAKMASFNYQYHISLTTTLFLHIDASLLAVTQIDHCTVTAQKIKFLLRVQRKCSTESCVRPFFTKRWSPKSCGWPNLFEKWSNPFNGFSFLLKIQFYLVTNLSQQTRWNLCRYRVFGENVTWLDYFSLGFFLVVYMYLPYKN